MSDDTDEKPAASVIRLVPMPEREAQADAAYQTLAMTEAITMLEEALEFAKGRPEGARVTGVAIAFAFEDRAYGRHLPLHADNYGSLVAAVADAQYGLLKHTNGDS